MRSEFFDAAKKHSYQADYRGSSSRVKIGAVAVYRRMIIAKGCNQNKTHPLQQKYNRYRYNISSNHYCPSKIHAEMEVVTKIQHLDINFSEVEIYVYRETRDGRKALAKPCLACETALRELGIRRVYYTGNNSYISEVYE